MRKAIASLAAAGRGTRHEMTLQTAFAISLMYTKSMTGEAQAALTRAVELAKSLHKHSQRDNLGRWLAPLSQSNS